ncbi:hypothetical protein C0993_006832 [Termitomyces sp. T159_Od127]|nr:hypothetical protein C0993_006832 [Termitomyces sp. T159_Od127]
MHSPPCNNPPPLRQPVASSTPQPPFQGPPQPAAPPRPLPSHPFNANSGPLPPKAPPPLQWAQGPPPGNNGGPPPSGEPLNGGPPNRWSPAMDAFPPQCGRGNHSYYYYNAAPPLHNSNSQDNICNALMCKGKLNIQKPESFHGHDPCKWRTFLTQCLTMFQAKPLTFQLEKSCVAFTASYLQGIAFNHYTALLQFDPNSPILSNWQAFAQEFSTNVNRPLGLHPQIQLNAADTQEALDPNQADNNLPKDSHNALDYADNEEALLCSTNPHIDWQNLTLHFDRQALECPEPISFDVATLVSAADHPHTPLQLHSKFTWLFILNAQLSKFLQILTTLINSGATRTFVSDWLDLTHNSLDRPMELQFFNGKLTTTGPITKMHTSSITLDNSL